MHTWRNEPLSQIRGGEGEAALKIFGANVRRERVMRSMSQQKLARLTDLNVRTICKIEAGEADICGETVQRLRQAIGCSLSNLVQGRSKVI